MCKARICSLRVFFLLVLVYFFIFSLLLSSLWTTWFHSPVNGCGTVLHWFLIQIFSRSYFSAAPALFGVPQGSLLEALWLSLYRHHRVPPEKMWSFVSPLCWCSRIYWQRIPPSSDQNHFTIKLNYMLAFVYVERVKQTRAKFNVVFIVVSHRFVMSQLKGFAPFSGLLSNKTKIYQNFSFLN